MMVPGGGPEGLVSSVERILRKQALTRLLGFWMACSTGDLIGDEVAVVKDKNSRPTSQGTLLRDLGINV
jgi:hypothetical protein